MGRWCEAIQRDMTMRTQIDPISGDFTKEDDPGYSPTALVMVDYTWRLVGISEEHEILHWNVRPNHPAAQDARLEMRTDANLRTCMHYAAGGARLELAGKLIAEIEGGAARLTTNFEGAPKMLMGIETKPQTVTVRLPSRPPRKFTVRANEAIPLS